MRAETEHRNTGSRPPRRHRRREARPGYGSAGCAAAQRSRSSGHAMRRNVHCDRRRPRAVHGRRARCHGRREAASGWRDRGAIAGRPVSSAPLTPDGASSRRASTATSMASRARTGRGHRRRSDRLWSTPHSDPRGRGSGSDLPTTRRSLDRGRRCHRRHRCRGTSHPTRIAPPAGSAVRLAPVAERGTPAIGVQRSRPGS